MSKGAFNSRKQMCHKLKKRRTDEIMQKSGTKREKKVCLMHEPPPTGGGEMIHPPQPFVPSQHPYIQLAASKH